MLTFRSTATNVPAPQVVHEQKAEATLANDREVQIFVRNLNGKTMAIMVSPLDTVTSLHVKIEERTGIPASEQRVLYAGKQLEAGKSLADYNVQKESTLHLGEYRSMLSPPLLNLTSVQCFACVEVFEPPTLSVSLGCF